MYGVKSAASKNSLSLVLATLVAWLVMSSTAQAGEAEIAYLGLDERGPWQVWVMNDDGSQARQVTQSAYDKVRVSWFPDGDQLFVNAADGHVYRVALQSGDEQRIDITLQGFQDAVLSPDGERMTFSLSTSGSVDDSNIWVANLDSEELKKLTGMARLQHEPTWGPHGRYIYFLSGGGGQSHNIWRVSLKSRETEQITAKQAYHFDVAISADGTLAYSNNRDGYYDLWLRRTDGEEQRLTNDQSLDARPSWSPDGSRIIFASSRGGGLDLWLLEVESKALTRLTNTQGGARFPVWYRGAGQP